MHPTAAQDDVVRFGIFEADLRSGELRRNGIKVKIQELPFRALKLLLSRAGEVLSREEFRKALWPDDVFVDFDHGISSAINRLRDALDDSADNPIFIETVERRGYRWIAPVRGEARVTEVSASIPEPVLIPAKNAPVQGSPAPSPRWRWVWVLSAFALLLVAWTFRQGSRAAKASARLFNGRDSSAVLSPIRSVAVLPLQNFSNDGSQEYFVDGMTDELITDLAQIPELKVVSRTSIMQYKGAHTPLPQIGHELGVDAVVEGSVLRSGDRVRITAQLIRTATDRHVWAQAYDGDLKDVLALQARVAEAITNEVKLNLTAEESGRLRRGRSVDPEAYDLYLRGRYAWSQRNVEGYEKAVGYLSQAIAKDPNFALAYATLADCQTLLGFNGSPTGMTEAKATAEKALQLDDTLAEAHTSLAVTKILLDWDWAGAEREFHQALHLDPNSAQAHHWYGNLLLGPEGRHEEAIAELQSAHELDPLSAIISTDTGFAYYLAGRYDAARETYQKVLAAHPNFPPALFYLGKYYDQTGQRDLAVKVGIQNSRLAGLPEVARHLQQLYDQGGYQAVADAQAKRGSASGAGVCELAANNALLGRNAAALDALERCNRTNGRVALLYLKVDPAWANLRSEPRYQELLRRMHLQE
jgi:TolB-like protein/DNA-binding winged helix-turn-helix (wHTH) protein